MKNKNLWSVIVGFALTTVMLCTSIYAWFYFPSSKTLVVKTAPEFEVETALYHLVTGSDGTRSFVAVENSDGQFIVNRELTFFQWGGEYVCESEVDDYYAMTIVYEDGATYKTGYLNSIIEAALACSGVEYEDENGETKNLRFSLVKVGYAYSASADTVLSSANAVTEALEANYRDLVISSGVADSGEPILVLTGSAGQALKEIGSDADAYLSSYIETEGSSGSGAEKDRIRLVVYFNVRADDTNVNTQMPDITAFGDKISINIKNTLTLSVVLRSIPKKAE